MSRNANERLLKIHHLIGARKYPNTFTIAAELEVSRKTIKRDLQWMKDHWQLPIEYDRQRHGLFYSEAVDKFPGVPTVTEAEMFALMVASKAIEQYQATPFHQPLQMAFHKLTSQLNNQERYSLHDFESILSFRAFAPEITDLERFETITRASHHGRAIRFEYRKPGAPQSEMRHVHPYHVACLDNSWYLVGYDEARSDTRTFVINRICGSVFVGDKFPKPLNFDINKYLRGSFAIMKGEGNYEVVIQFDAWSTDVLRHRLWHSTQQITALPGGGCRLAMRLTGLEEVERWILSWGCHATVLQPASLRDRLAKIAQDLAAKYASP